jgi:hypothetical protein
MWSTVLNSLEGQNAVSSFDNYSFVFLGFSPGFSRFGKRHESMVRRLTTLDVRSSNHS